MLGQKLALLGLVLGDAALLAAAAAFAEDCGTSSALLSSRCLGSSRRLCTLLEGLTAGCAGRQALTHSSLRRKLHLWSRLGLHRLQGTPAATAQPDSCCKHRLTHSLIQQGVEAATPAQTADGEEGAAVPAEGEEDCSAEFKPIIQLSEVESVSGEEAETALCDL